MTTTRAYFLRVCDYSKVGMAALHGPELPLEMFVKREERPRGLSWKEYDHYHG